MTSASPAAEARALWDVVFFSSVDYSSHWQRPQAVASELAALGARVLYVDNLGMRLPRLNDRARIARRVRSTLEPREQRTRSGPVPGPSLAADAMTVLSPLLPPVDPLRIIDAITSRWLSNRVRAWRRESGEQRPLVVWTYLPTPVVSHVADHARADAVVYEYADLASVRLQARSERHRRRVARWEEQMFHRADAIFTPTPQLLEARGIHSPRARVIPHGSPQSDPGRRDKAGAAKPRSPRIAFVGSISPVVDLALLEGVAARRPDWRMVIIGPARVPLRTLTRLPNVDLLGEKPHDEVLAILDTCDVGIIPYVQDAPGVSTVSPLKLHDYRSRGLPVVSIDIPAVQGLADVEIAAGESGFVDAIERALSRGRGPARRGGSWAVAVREMVAQVREILP